MLDLLLEGRVPALLQRIRSIPLLLRLPLQRLHHLLLEVELVVYLVDIGLMPLLMFIQFPLEALNFFIFVLHFFLDPQFHIFLELLHPFGPLFLLFGDP